MASAALRATDAGSSPPARRLVRSRRICASLARCSASRRRTPSRVTTHPMRPAAITKTAAATTSSPLLISSECLGGVKNQFSDRNPATAATAPAIGPCSAARSTATSRTKAPTVMSASVTSPTPVAMATSPSATRNGTQRRIFTIS